MEGSSSRKRGKGSVALVVGVTGMLLTAAINRFNGTAAGYEYYIVGNAILCFFIPMTIIFLMGEDASDFGFASGNWRKIRWWVLAMLAVMIVVLIPFSRRPEMQAYYPFFRRFGTLMGGVPYSDGNWMILMYGWISYGMYMFFWEFFFRGYLLFGLARKIGWGAIIVQAIPFFILHHSKPPMEFAVSLPAGIILGVLAYYSKSFVPCFVLHWLVSVSSDILVIAGRPHGH